MSCKGTPEELAQIGKEYNIEKMLVHSTATKAEQVESVNNFLISQINENPEFVGFGTLHPEYGFNERETERLMKNNVKGIKFHPDFCRIDILSKGMYDIFALISGKMHIMFHVGDNRYTYSHPSRIKKVMEDFPNLSVIGAHMGGYTAWEESLDILCGGNLYFDTSSSLSFITPQLAQKIIYKHGVEKILFATDYPMWHIKDEIEKFMKIPLSDSEREKIFYGNAKELLNV
jgi:predicted TIM-barrel fold metal-dependent hydrolase